MSHRNCRAAPKFTYAQRCISDCRVVLRRDTLTRSVSPSTQLLVTLFDSDRLAASSAFFGAAPYTSNGRKSNHARQVLAFDHIEQLHSRPFDMSDSSLLHAFAGGAAGAASLAITYPLYSRMVRQQTQEQKNAAGVVIPAATFREELRALFTRAGLEQQFAGLSAALYAISIQVSARLPILRAKNVRCVAKLIRLLMCTPFPTAVGRLLLLLPTLQEPPLRLDLASRQHPGQYRGRRRDRHAHQSTLGHQLETDHAEGSSSRANCCCSTFFIRLPSSRRTSCAFLPT